MKRTELVAELKTVYSALRTGKFKSDELSEKMGVSKTTIYRRLRELENIGVIERKSVKWSDIFFPYDTTYSLGLIDIAVVLEAEENCTYGSIAGNGPCTTKINRSCSAGDWLKQQCDEIDNRRGISLLQRFKNWIGWE